MAHSVDLHTHTTCSDGRLTPGELLQAASAAEVGLVSITDHDSVSAYERLAAVPPGLVLIPGIELSTQWQGRGIHVLGLGIDPEDPGLRKGVQLQSAARRERAVEIGRRLARKGIRGSFEASCELAGSEHVGRLHFARYLVETGQVDDLQQAFKKYLGDGKAGDVKTGWADLERVIGWIRGSGGIAVLAHPLKYRLTRTRLRRLLTAFRKSGGRGLEVVSGQQQPFETKDMATLANEFGLLASCGSDFHEPGKRWAELGRVAPLPTGCEAVWNHFSF